MFQLISLKNIQLLSRSNSIYIIFELLNILLFYYYSIIIFEYLYAFHPFSRIFQSVLAALLTVHRDASLIFFSVCHIMFHVDALAQKLKLYLKVLLLPCCLLCRLSLWLFFRTFLACGWHVIYFCGHCAPASEEPPKAPKL